MPGFLHRPEGCGTRVQYETRGSHLWFAVRSAHLEALPDVSKVGRIQSWRHRQAGSFRSSTRGRGRIICDGKRADRPEFLVTVKRAAEEDHRWTIKPSCAADTGHGAEPEPGASINPSPRSAATCAAGRRRGPGRPVSAATCTHRAAATSTGAHPPGRSRGRGRSDRSRRGRNRPMILRPIPSFWRSCAARESRLATSPNGSGIGRVTVGCLPYPMGDHGSSRLDPMGG